MKLTATLNTLWGQWLVEELKRLGVVHFCVAPGSRTTPITAAIARLQGIKSIVHFDERSLAFHALGIAAATYRPVVVVTTSGTALANVMPAVIEASKKKLPLIIISADRPPELRQTGAHQTIDQVKIFGSYVKHFVDMPTPSLDVPARFVLSTADQLYFQAMTQTPGVVHLNCMFREPLLGQPIKSKELDEYCSALSEWRSSSKPLTQYINTQQFSNQGLEEISPLLAKSKMGLIVVGKVHKDSRDSILALAKHLQWPIWADVSSGLRLGIEQDELINYFDQMLLNDKIAKEFQPEVVLHLGGRITSKRYYQWLESQPKGLNYVMVLTHALRHDPTYQVTHRVVSSVKGCCEYWLTHLKRKPKTAVMKLLTKANQQIGQMIDAFLFHQPRMNEIAAARLVSTMIPAGHGLFLSNSMPIRDMDMYADHQGQEVYVNGNRGASGIDGIIATAAGYASGLNKPVTLMIGDLAALYDINALALLRELAVPVVIIVLNNGGGGIFSFLPIAQERDIFSKFYATPHSYSFAGLAHSFELAYSQPLDVEMFKKAYRQALASQTSTIIEIFSSTEDNVALHEALKSSINQIVSQLKLNA